MRLFRLFKILLVAFRFGLDEFLLGHERVRALRVLVRRLSFWRRLDQPRAVRLRLALENLGPIFVKFGQLLSTRRDLLPADIADELAKLQDRVPPFDSELVMATLERVYGKPLSQVFAELRRNARRERLGCTGAPRVAAGRNRSCGQGAAARHRAA